MTLSALIPLILVALFTLSSAQAWAVEPIGAVPPPTMIPTDITPFGIAPARNIGIPEYKYRLFQKLPSKLWFTGTYETTLRSESNIFSTSRSPQRDGVFRVAPTVTLGYDIFNKTGIYCNWFLIKDVFFDHGKQLSFPTTQSVSLGVRRDFTLNKSTTAELDFQARQLWQSANLTQADLLPTLTITRVMTPRLVAFASAVLQMRSGKFFQGATREIDPFYSIGLSYTMGNWHFTANNTYTTNFRNPPFRQSVPKQGNVSMIADFELSRPVILKFPSLQAFVRAEPVWNWESHRTPGLSGFDFRFFGGLRIAFAKPSLSSSIDALRKQLQEAEPAIHPPPEKDEQKEENQPQPPKEQSKSITPGVVISQLAEPLAQIHPALAPTSLSAPP